MSQTRAQDPSIRIVREIPLWGLISLLLTVAMFGAGQFISQYYAQQAQATAIAALTIRIESLVTEVKLLNAQINIKDTKDVQHDTQISNLERRVSDLEMRRSK